MSKRITVRLDKEVYEMLQYLVKVQEQNYGDMGVEINDSTAIRMSIQHTFKYFVDNRVQCPNCKGDESPYSVELVGRDEYKCFECQTVFKP